MYHIQLRNIGPIQEAELQFNHLNVFIGPQSSGKSTIAKIISFCMWLEKDIILKQGKAHIDKEYLKRELILFHEMSTYFIEDSFLRFNSSLIDFTFHNLEDFSIHIIGDFQEECVGKVAYIPSERNVLSIPGISTLPLGYTYVRGFIFDWLSLRDKYKEAFPLLSLGSAYHYDDQNGDRISLGKGKDISLSQASSGLQAIIPILVYTHYVTHWVYDNNLDISFDKYYAIQKVLLKDMVKNDNQVREEEEIEEALKIESLKEQLSKLLSLIYHDIQNTNFRETADLVSRIGKPHFTNLVIEEPEMNIFPETQYTLIKELVGQMDFSRGDRLTLTTHSPYILTSINNLIQADNAIREGQDASVVSQVIPSASQLAFDKVSAWSVSNGTITPITDSSTQLISAEALDSASDYISSDFDRLI
ncbi:MAG: AAA family ATPase [Prevotellaceae bacterium]|nr:AAA family ATPase [Prevotellaceae bacterium]MDY6131355.1 AAA family ATPase [Prevotella sp.]